MTIGPIEFAEPAWLLLAPLFWALVLWLGRRSIAGLGRATGHVAVALRLLVLTGVAAALAEPSWRQPGEGVAAIAVVDVSASMPRETAQRAGEFLEEAWSAGADPTADALGLVTAGRGASVLRLPRPVLRDGDVRDAAARARTAGLEAGATNLSEAVRLATALRPEGRAGRVVLVSDGMETSGGLLAAAERAAAAGVPIDVLPVTRDAGAEVVVDDVVTPKSAREGQAADVRIVLRSTGPARGRLTLLRNGRPIDLDPDSDALSTLVALGAGERVLTVPVRLATAGPQEFEAFWEPTEEGADAIAGNNRAASVTFVSGEGRVLIFAPDAQQPAMLADALAEAGVRAEVRTPEQGYGGSVGLQAFDAVVLFNVPAERFPRRDMEELRTFVHDGGGGLVMVGGPDSFGAGGWIGTPVADTLPVRMDPPQERQLPRGALALVLDCSGSMSMPVAGSGLSQMQVAARGALYAAQSLTRLDYIAVYTFDTVTNTIVPLRLYDDPVAVERAIRGIPVGGGTNMFPALEFSFREILKADRSTRHIVVLSDGRTTGDPDAGLALARQMASAGVTLSTISIGDGSNDPLMAQLAASAGGTYYPVQGGPGLLALPQIFIKEARTLQHALIWEGEPVSPVVTGAGAIGMRGVGGRLPPVTGYIVTVPRQGLSNVTAVIPNEHEDPFVAQWQHGLGRAVAVTGEPTSRWSASWAGWDGFRAFWEQHIRWAMRPSGSANVNVVTADEGERTRVTISALDDAGDTLNFARFRGRVITPDGSAVPLSLRQSGPGRYEAFFDSPEEGSYLVALGYETPATNDPETGEPAPGAAGVVRAAHTRAFAEELRRLGGDRGLLEQVASATGGRVLAGDPRADELFSRTGLTMPVTLRPIWLAVALVSFALFVLDVAVRRVRIDLPALAAAAKRLVTREKKPELSGMAALREARARVRDRITTAAANGSAADTQQDAAVARRVAEPAPELAASAAAPAVLESERRAGAAPLAQAARAAADQHRSRPADPNTGAEEPEGMSRLLSAKRRAREHMTDDHHDKH